jgi:GNAT superfamily N-acetyltransferase
MSALPSARTPGAGIFAARDGRYVLIRPIWHGDAAALRRMHARLSPDTIYRRFMTTCPRGPSNATLRYLTVLDHRAREALVAVHRSEVVAVARYHALDERTAEIAVIVEDAWQRQGIARELILRLTSLAWSRGIRAFSGTILAENRAAVELMKSVFPGVRTAVSHGEIEFHIDIEDVLPKREHVVAV